MKRVKIQAYTLLFICFFISQAYASESAYEKHLARGISAVEAGRNSAAAEAFGAALKEKPNDHTATLYMGIAQSRSKDNQAESTLKKALSLDPKDPRTNLEMGIWYYGKQVFGEADDYFDNTIKLAPGSAFAKKAEEYLHAIKRGGVRRPLGLALSLGGQYDSNVVLNPGNGPLSQGISNKSDWRAVFLLKGKYNIFETPKAEGSVGYSLYKSLHSRLTEYNLTQHRFEAGGGYRISVLEFRGSYQFEHLTAGSDPYDYAHTLTPSLTITEGGGLSTVLEYRYRKSHYMDSDLFIGNAERSGSNNLYGVTQNIKIGQSVAVAIGYSYDKDSTRRDFWDYKGNKGTADLKVTFPGNVYGNLSGEFYKKDYRGNDPVAGDVRKDKMYTAGIALTKTYSERYSLSLGQLYIKNKSNIKAYDYKRLITSLFLNARF